MEAVMEVLKPAIEQGMCKGMNEVMNKLLENVHKLEDTMIDVLKKENRTLTEALGKVLDETPVAQGVSGEQPPTLFNQLIFGNNTAHFEKQLLLLQVNTLIQYIGDKLKLGIPEAIEKAIKTDKEALESIKQTLAAAAANPDQVGGSKRRTRRKHRR